ncbi:hypothetical protein GCM10023210_03760 [Chryseobacterium ginsengisoli]|uniref:DUF4230 domain-containing protein n=1 Tax=Chryseobacterium ginsengisoli TaxID=363853 RepID=A0ABP9LUU5_9FLAO
MKKIIVSLLIIISFILLLILTSYLTKNSDEKFTIRDVKAEFRGVIKEKIAKRKNLYLDIKLKQENKNDTIIEASNFISEISIGDTIIKKNNSPYFYRINNAGIKKIPFTYFSEKMLKSPNIPKSWKDSLNSSWKALIIKETVE